MSRKPIVLLPDLDDDDAAFRARLSPLVEAALPDIRKSGKPNDRISGEMEYRRSATSSKEKAVYPEIHNSILPEDRISGGSLGLVEAAAQQARIEGLRGAKRRYEYLIPERVGKALADDAAAHGKSATTLLLEVLRDAGYPVIPEDLVDLRKMPKR